MVEIHPAAPSARFILRGPAASGPAAAAFGCPIPETPLRAATAGTRAALWLGPDEWLLLLPPAEAEAAEAALAAALSDTPHALVDVSHRQEALSLHGPDAALVLNTAVPLDLAPHAFPPGLCARTLCDKAEVILWRTGPESWHLEAWRSFMPYVHSLLIEAAETASPP